MFIASMRLREDQVMVFQHRPQATFLPQKEKTKGADLAQSRKPTCDATNANFSHALQNACCVCLMY
eukprot:SAG31_NODE_12114_length_967_cov_1.474654_2_plen_65_part_01